MSRITEAQANSTYRPELAAKTVGSAATNPILAATWERELNIWLSLRAPQLAPLLKVCRFGGRLLALMPRYDCSLRNLVRAGPISLASSLTFLSQVAACVDHVFRFYGVVHLDLKPSNVLVHHRAGESSCFVSDWGISRLLIPRAGAGASLAKLSIDVRSEIPAGSLPYMSPERLLGVASGPSADVFSLGIMAFELLTGLLPFHGGSEIADQIVSGEYWGNIRRVLKPSFTGGTADFVLVATHPDPSRRLADARAFAKGLRKL